MDSDSLSKPSESRRAILLLGVFAALFIVQIVLYREAFKVEPSGDDLNAPLADIWRGEADGPLALVTRSAQPHNYRPLQSLTMWAFGRISSENRVFWIHVPHFIGMLVFSVAAWLWLKKMPVSIFAAFCGALVLFIHPALVAPLASVDGFATLFSTGLMWISTYCVFRWRDRLSFALVPALLTFALGLGFKEYALGAVPLACLAMLCVSDSFKQALSRTMLVGLAFSLVVIVFIAIRRVTVPPPALGQEVGYLVIAPITWIKNAAMFIGVLLFPGSTKWMFVSGSASAFGISAASILICGVTLLLGLNWRWFGSSVRTPSPSHAAVSTRAWIVFSMLALAGASFPAVLIFHVSEMYVAGLIIPLAMLVALATDGFRSRSARVRLTGAALLVSAVVWCVLSVQAKVADIRRMGDMTVSMLRDIMAVLPPDARDLTIAACFPEDLPGARYYSVFEARPRLLIEQPQSLWWVAPDRNLSMAFPQPTLEHALSNLESYDAIFSWNPDEQSMRLVRARPFDTIHGRE